MKKIIVYLTVAVLASLSLQAGEAGKDKAACCDSKAKTTSACSAKSGSKSVAKAPQTAKGAQLAVR